MCPRPSLSPSPLHGASRGRALAAGVACAWALALSAEVSAETLVVPDPTAVPEQGELAGAVSLLVRSYLTTGQRIIAPRRELALAIEALTGKTPGKNLTVSGELGPRLIERMASDALIVWELQVGQKGTTVAGTMIGAGGKRLLRISASAATGDVAELARRLAKRIAPAIGVTLGDMAEAGLADVRPFVAAESAMVSSDPVAASRAVDSRTAHGGRPFGGRQEHSARSGW